jgi:hypothetical protein
MSTNSTIALLHKVGLISRIYCHFDGQVENRVGEKLFKHYNDYDKITQLVSMGALSYLEKNIVPTDDSHSFAHPQDDVCVFFHRDRGEKLSKQIYVNIEAYKRDCKYFPYNYIYMPTNKDDHMSYEWYLVKNDVDRTTTKLSSYFIK